MNLSGKIRLALVFIGFTFFAIVVGYVGWKISKQSSPISSVEQEQTISVSPVGKPMRLKIPNIGVDAVVESLALAPDGAMDTPKGPDTVAWFELGSLPGENGSAVITGHYGTWKNGQGSVFDNLHQLKAGDKIYVEDENGVRTAFVVREQRSLEPNADATDIFSSEDEQSHLNLITCEGTWNKDSKSYSKRLVVFADKE
ncbi:MAG: class F sortase [Candidatus Moranbacteria bacterium]|nr:class F sortase [Candidatus Moranbacteria bacterium]